MASLKGIESAVKKLSETDLSAFRAWFEEFDAQRWDRQFAADAASGKLDEMAKQAAADFKAGKCKEI